MIFNNNIASLGNSLISERKPTINIIIEHPSELIFYYIILRHIDFDMQVPYSMGSVNAKICLPFCNKNKNNCIMINKKRAWSKSYSDYYLITLNTRSLPLILNIDATRRALILIQYFNLYVAILCLRFIRFSKENNCLFVSVCICFGAKILRRLPNVEFSNFNREYENTLNPYHCCCPITQTWATADQMIVSYISVDVVVFVVVVLCYFEKLKTKHNTKTLVSMLFESNECVLHDYRWKQQAI